VLELNVDLTGDRLRVTVIDHGSGFEPPQPTGGDESGWVLFIVDRLSHHWGVDRAEKDVGLVRDASRRRAGARAGAGRA